MVYSFWTLHLNSFRSSVIPLDLSKFFGRAIGSIALTLQRLILRRLSAMLEFDVGICIGKLDDWMPEAMCGAVQTECEIK